MKNVSFGAGVVAVAVLLCLQAKTSAQKTDSRAVLDRYCVSCHNERVKTANLILDRIDVSTPGANPAVWEKVVHKLRTGTMQRARRADRGSGIELPVRSSASGRRARAAGRPRVR